MPEKGVLQDMLKQDIKNDKKGQSVGMLVKEFNEFDVLQLWTKGFLYRENWRLQNVQSKVTRDSGDQKTGSVPV